MKIKLFSIIFFLSFSIQAIAQYYTPQSPISIPKSNLDKSSIVQTLNSERVLFKPIDIDELRLAIRKSNNAVENDISLIKSKMSNLFMDKQELMQLKDIKKINEVIAEKKKNKKEIEEQVQSDLSSINYKGLFIVVQKDIDPWASKQQLADLSEKALTPKAVEDLNGVFISSMTTIESSQLISDKIIATVSGEMSVEKQYISRTIDNRTKFLYLVRVNVTPLKKTIKTLSTETAASETHLIVNAMTEKEYGAMLQDFGVSQDEIGKIVFEVQSSQESVRLANATAGRRQADILKNGNANINKIDEEIQTLENSLTNRSGILKQIIEEKTNVVYDRGNPDKSIEKALSYLDSELDALKNQLISTKERELIPRYSVSVTAEGTPAEDIAKTAMDIAGQIEQSYSKIEQFMEETTVENFMLTEYSRGQQKDVYRKVDTVWLYPVAGDRDNFLLTVVVKFEITDKTVKSTSTERRPTISKPSEETVDDEMVFVKGGEFMMGNESGIYSKPVHRVILSDFYIDKYEVTVGQYRKFCDETGRKKPKTEKYDTDKHPVRWMSWEDAAAYAKWVGKRLPTEAEWEYAARGGNKSKGYKYSGSDDVAEVAWCQENARGKFHPVGLKKPNELGIYDMSGNAEEWCSDWFDGDYYHKSSLNNPQGPTGPSVARFGNSKVVRGSPYQQVDQVTRRRWLTVSGGYHHGFRCARSAEPKQSSTQDINTMTDIDGNVYKTVKIGNQVWMAENLRVTHYRNGDPISNVTDKSIWAKLKTGAYCAYEHKDNYSDTYGYLYNWYAVADSRNIAPEGWHVPTAKEWEILKDFLNYDAGKLMVNGTGFWKLPNEYATNQSGFSAIPGGARSSMGEFVDLFEKSYFWSVSEFTPGEYAISIYLWYTTRTILDEYSTKRDGLSVRLLKD